MGLILSLSVGTAASAEPTPRQVETVDILVARKKIEGGTLIREPEVLFKIKKFIKGQEPKAAITRIEDLKNKFAIRTMREDDFVTPDDLISNGPLQIEKGTRAYAIRIDSRKLTDRFVVSSQRVDVILTVGTDKGQGRVETLLANMLVLAVDAPKPPRRGDPPGGPLTVTLQVTDTQGRKLAAAQEQGSLSLFVRPPQ
jgi:Flp pilus assembly protein CpaB